MENLFINPVSKLFLAVPLLYALDIVLFCPCHVTVDCHQTEFFTDLLVTLGIATILLTWNISI